MRYTLTTEKSGMQWCTGVHVPDVARAASDSMSLTLLACGSGANSIQRADEIFSNLRFRRDAVR